jgi:hypothetical protein
MVSLKFAVQHHFRRVVTGGGDFGFRRAHRHHHFAVDAEHGAGERHALRVVAREQATTPLRFSASVSELNLLNAPRILNDTLHIFKLQEYFTLTTFAEIIRTRHTGFIYFSCQSFSGVLNIFNCHREIVGNVHNILVIIIHFFQAKSGYQSIK